MNVPEPLSIPLELKKITHFLRRAEELDNDKTRPESRLIAYYCRHYAVSVGINLSNTALARKCLSSIIANLESEREAMSNFSRKEAQFVCRKFAISVLLNADREERAGVACMNTARKFYAASNFFEMLQQFEDVEDYRETYEEDKQRRLYCKWRATEILKVLKEGQAVEQKNSEPA